MRTTLTIDDEIVKQLKSVAYHSGKSFKDTVNETLRVGLNARESKPQAKPYKLTPAALGGVMPGIDLDKALQLAAALEDEEITRKLLLRK